ncbi:MAG TPA: Spy/CpxP family protein refolding chaperone [Blastocatellia bacterium]|nr:Spy/CpxP family protein refolding chaperone [Blastocatellia bacterium]
MKLTRRITITVGIAALVVAGTIFAFAGAQQRHALAGKFGGQHAPRFIQRFLDRASVFLGLTDAQEEQIKAILAAEKPTVEPLVRQLAANRKALNEATGGGNFNEAEVKAIAARQGETLAALIVEKEKVKTQVFGVLTPEQRQKAEQFRERIEQRIREHFSE